MTSQSSPATATLLPCPFCGNAPFVDDDRDGVCTVACATDDCVGVEITCPTLDDATGFWNRRAPSPSSAGSDHAKVADWLDDQARIATNSLHCGDNSVTIQRTHAWARKLEAAALYLRAPAQAAPVPALAEFFKWAMREGPWEGGDLDGGSIQDKAESLGLIVKTKFDPEKHGTAYGDFSEGDDYYEFAPGISLPSTDQSTTGAPGEIDASGWTGIESHNPYRGRR